MNQRERFEATLGNRLPTGRSRANKDEYEYVPTHFAWLAWQEAERQMIERCAKVCDDESDAFSGYAHGSYNGIYDNKSDAAKDCAESIRELGRQE